MVIQVPTQLGFRLALTTAALLVAVSANAGIVVGETFGGTGAALNGTTAETFDAGITTAGGSNTGLLAIPFQTTAGSLSVLLASPRPT